MLKMPPRAAAFKDAFPMCLDGDMSDVSIKIRGI